MRISGNYTSLNVSGLKGSSQYFLAVSAFNTAGTGPQSVSVNATTKKPREFLKQYTLIIKLQLCHVTTIFKPSHTLTHMHAVE